MYHPLWIATGLAILPLGLWYAPLWRLRRILSPLLMASEAAVVVLVFVSGHGILATLLLSIALYKWVNYARIIKGRMQHDYLWQNSWRTGWQLTAASLIVLLFADFKLQADGTVILGSLAVLQLLVAIIVASSTSRHLKTTKTLQAAASYTDAQLPTLSVLVPARNETDDLQQCLDCLVSSSYPKLEIIVLDDCSQQKRTPEIIRSYAHDGVRFIAGQPADDSWLAKNYAYQQLAEAASGEYLLFCGVDVRMKPTAMRELVTTMLEKQKTMLSVLPRNRSPRSIIGGLVQPMRYVWELCLPRRLFSRPPVLSTCWIVTRELFDNAGSFKSSSRSILPEVHFARFASRGDGYSFLRSDMLISDKSLAEQQATAIRMRYPQLRRRLELVWGLSALQLLGVAACLPVTVALFANMQPTLGAVALLALILQQYAYISVTSVMYGRPLIISGLIAPLYDLILLNYSMFRYEFRDVIWKGRNVCLPVMRIDPAQKS